MSDPTATTGASIRRFILAGWVVLMAAGLAVYCFNPDHFTPERIALFLRPFRTGLLIAFLIVSVVRAFFLIPSTPFILAGSLLFPEQPGVVILISMVGIALSAGLIYRFSDWLGFRAQFDQLSRSMMTRMEALLNSRMGFFYLVFWAFFPLAPTDAACYAAGMIRMPFWRFLAGICLGELVICCVYVFAGRSVWEWMVSYA